MQTMFVGKYATFRYYVVWKITNFVCSLKYENTIMYRISHILQRSELHKIVLNKLFCLLTCLHFFFKTRFLNDFKNSIHYYSANYSNFYKSKSMYEIKLIFFLTALMYILILEIVAVKSINLTNFVIKLLMWFVKTY